MVSKYYKGSKMHMWVIMKNDFGPLVQGMHEVLELLDSDRDTIEHLYLKIYNTNELSVILFSEFCWGLRV